MDIDQVEWRNTPQQIQACLIMRYDLNMGVARIADAFNTTAKTIKEALKDGR